MISTPDVQGMPREQPLVPALSHRAVASGLPSKADSRFPAIVLASLAALSVGGIAFALWLRTVPAGNADPRFFFNVFYFLFAHNEVAGLAIVAVFSSVAAGFLFRSRERPHGSQIEKDGTAWPAWYYGGVAALVFFTAAMGSQLVFHDYLLTADENLADFQAKIFMRGQIQAEVPAAWLPVVRVIKPTFIEYFPTTHRWNATYLPVYAAMRAVFQSIHLQSLLNPFLAAVTVLALYGTVRNIWPESKTNARLAVLLLATSSQFLLMAMTAYSMPAHLALNTVWLWLYSHRDRRLFFLAPIVGILALGLHQPFFHALFAAPFLFRLVLKRQWRASFIFAAIYMAGCALWLYWSRHFRAEFGTGSVTSIFKLSNPRMAFVQPMDFLLVIGWSCLATPLLAILGARQGFRLKPILQDALISCVLTFGFYYFFYLDQAHGWGYRYFHGALACLVLVAIAGLERLRGLIGERRAHLFVYTAVAASILIQFPLRCFQAERFVRPYARANAAIHSMPQKIVGLDPRDAWYSADLIRNDPFLEDRPVVVALYQLHPVEIAALQKNGDARFVTREQLARLGLFTNSPNNYRHDPFKLGSPP